METNKKLYETINTQKEALKNFNPEIFEIPKYITENLKHTFFVWQEAAFENFLFYENPQSKLKKSPTHLMFNMATGTGKTLLMAAAILYYYKQGYRHFLFFVNQNNIIDKTENNFIENTHNKYLFKEKIVIDNKTIAIKKVGTFSDEPQGIEIKFTSIQKLYNDIHLERENKTTLADLQEKNIVMLADEAHHLNANTKNVTIQKEMFEEKLSGSQAEKEKKGWEHTVIELILNKNDSKKENKNVLLEFTATIPNNQNVVEKYQDKIIYQFTLEKFLQAGYTKEINLLPTTLGKKERVLQALLFQWYRHTIAVKHGIANFKPVILFRSKTIEESKQDYKDFLGWIENLKADDFNFSHGILEKITQSESVNEQGKSRTEQVLKFITENESINFIEIAHWIQQNYQERNTIITNSKTNKTKKEKTDEETEKLLNSLEDKNNHIRAIFTVDRLTEGWDVLNLFDIVRLYQGQNAGGSTKKTPEATTKEKQLIGRGVRYFPFTYQDKENNQRKFDEDLNHKLRILEELFYYTYDEESRYISHLKAELKKDGYIREDRTIKTFKLKENFKRTDLKIWYNEPKNNPNRQKKNLDTIKKDFYFKYKIYGLEISENVNVLDENLEGEQQIIKTKYTTISKNFEDIEKHIVQKAINIKAKQEDSLFQFENLKKELKIQSIDELQSKILADFTLRIISPTNYEEIDNQEKLYEEIDNQEKLYEEIDNQEKLKMVLQFLDKVFSELKEHITPKIGSKFEPAKFEKFFGEPKTKSIKELDENLKNLEKEILKNDWYVLDSFVGTSEEKALVDFIKNAIGNLQKKYDVYLLKNEEVYKIYDFDKGRGFAPDFLLFLKSKEKKTIGTVETELYYQIFIEPKGDQFKDLEGGFKNSKEGWKEEFLEQITRRYGFDKVIRAENPDYRLIGLPFFNKSSQTNFEQEFNELYNI